MARIQHRKEKEAERVRRKEEKAQRKDEVTGAAEEDPDIAGIIPGPQPRLDEDEF